MPSLTCAEEVSVVGAVDAFRTAHPTLKIDQQFSRRPVLDTHAFDCGPEFTDLITQVKGLVKASVPDLTDVGAKELIYRALLASPAIASNPFISGSAPKLVTSCPSGGGGTSSSVGGVSASTGGGFTVTSWLWIGAISAAVIVLGFLFTRPKAMKLGRNLQGYAGAGYKAGAAGVRGAGRGALAMGERAVHGLVDLGRKARGQQTRVSTDDDTPLLAGYPD